MIIVNSNNSLTKKLSFAIKLLKSAVIIINNYNNEVKNKMKNATYTAKDMQDFIDSGIIKYYMKNK